MFLLYIIHGTVECGRVVTPTLFDKECKLKYIFDGVDNEINSMNVEIFKVRTF